MTPTQILAMSALGVSPLALCPLLRPRPARSARRSTW